MQERVTRSASWVPLPQWISSRVPTSGRVLALDLIELVHCGHEPRELQDAPSADLPEEQHRKNRGD
eukprot:3326222-Rhodomonas_salina.3